MYSRKKIKLGFFGNINCMPFVYALEFKKLGYEIVFIVPYRKNNKLHRPENRFDFISYPYENWIVECNPIFRVFSFAFPKLFLKKSIDILNECDFVFLNDFGNSLRPYLKKELVSFSLLSGSDLDVFSRFDNIEGRYHFNKKFLKIFKPLLKRIIHKITVNQRAGIKDSKVVEFLPQGVNSMSDKLLDEIKGSDDYIRHQIRGIDFSSIHYSKPTKKEIVTVFNLARFIWKKPFPDLFNSGEDKGNDVMIKGIGLFYKKTGVRLNINFVEKGIHVEESRKLCEECGISDQITWHKEMTQKQVLDFYSRSDIVFDQLGPHTVGGGLEAMAVGRPLIGNGRVDVFTKILGEPVPLCQASTPQEVCVWLERLVPDFELRESLGVKAREFVLKYYNIEDSAKYFTQFFINEEKNNSVKYSAKI